MGLVDAHCHFWRLDRGDYGWLDGQGGPLAPIRRDFGPAQHPGDGPVIAVQAAPSLAETDYLLSLGRQTSRIAGVVGWVDLAAETAADDLRRLASDPLFKGIRPMLQDIARTDWLLEAPRPEVLALLPHLGLRFDALITPRHLPVLIRFARMNPDLPIVIDHAAKPQPGNLATWREGMARLASDRRIHCKLSGLVTELPDRDQLRAVIADLLDLFGPERLIWGSDWPVLTLAASWDEWMALTDQALSGLTGAERAAIMGGNAARFYGVTA
ncbi:amidohydrolase family protein [Paracoccus sp. M683]|uniref:amidohydrolase family protein n=1 Tax=Paracoccus sp. M683 TaxID=2594268 RepID=UPI0011800D4D|nr:amidohydrolase family protein [Paracoccus sp. M683]TRW96613.1 amidohydrolase family protein [Paracoccus sp. M683]